MNIEKQLRGKIKRLQEEIRNLKTSRKFHLIKIKDYEKYTTKNEFVLNGLNSDEIRRRLIIQTEIMKREVNDLLKGKVRFIK